MTVWKKLKYLQKGISHVQNGTNCQDSVLIFENEDCIVASLADGLGSLKYSEVAAQTATETVCNFFFELKNPFEKFDTKEDLAQHILDAVVMNIQDKANVMGVPLNEMDCTLVFVCVLKRPKQAIIGRLGDSAICVIAENKAIAINDGNKSANGTNAIFDNDAIENFDIKTLDLEEKNIYGFILSSDGLENELYMKGSDHVNKIAELYFNAWFINDDPVSVIEKRIAKLTEIEDTPFDDDISLAILSRSDKEISLPEDPKWLCTCGFRNHLQTTYCQRCHKDFSVLYKNICFRDYGGKAAFFTEINKDPDEEMRIIGMKAKATVLKQDNPIVESDLLQIPKTKTPSEVIKAPVSSIPHNGTRNTPQGKLVKYQQPAEEEAPIKKFDKQETDADLHKKLQTMVSMISKVATPLVGSDVKKEPTEAKKQTVIPEKQVTSKKTGVIPSEESKGKRNQENVPPCAEVAENTSKKAGDKHTSKTKKSRYNKDALKAIGVLMAITLVIGLFSGGVFVKNITSSKVSKLTKSVEELTEKVNMYEAELAEKETQPVVLLPEDFSVLEDGSYYWGTLDDLNMPHGFGIMEKDDIYYIGNFDHGKKNGEFSIVDSDSVHRVENYIDDELAPDKEVNEEDPVENEGEY